MAILFNEKSNNYLRTDIEVEQLIKNIELLSLIDGNIAISPGSPGARTTGNGLIYWEGLIELAVAVTPVQVLGTFDIRLAPKEGIRLVNAIVDSGGALSSIILSFDDTGSLVAHTAMAIGDIISLNGIYYYKGNF